MKETQIDTVFLDTDGRGDHTDLHCFLLLSLWSLSREGETPPRASCSLWLKNSVAKLLFVRGSKASSRPQRGRYEPVKKMYIFLIFLWTSGKKGYNRVVS
jgi:hypothetical protein